MTRVYVQVETAGEEFTFQSDPLRVLAGDDCASINAQLDHAVKVVKASIAESAVE